MSSDEHEVEISMELRINGAPRAWSGPPLRRLLDVLREDLGLTGSKEGCGEGECGACTVLIDGEPVNSCLQAVCQVGGQEIVTIESTGHADIAQSYLDAGGTQCGFCTPGMIMATRAWIDGVRAGVEEPTELAARTALAGNLCRCTGYGKIIESALRACPGNLGGTS